jgi:hypothetical protein
VRCLVQGRDGQNRRYGAASSWLVNPEGARTRQALKNAAPMRSRPFRLRRSARGRLAPVREATLWSDGVYANVMRSWQ